MPWVKCSEPATFSEDDGPACPYCGKIQNTIDAAGKREDENTESWTCDYCNKEFWLNVIVHYAWSATRKKVE